MSSEPLQYHLDLVRNAVEKTLQRSVAPEDLIDNLNIDSLDFQQIALELEGYQYSGPSFPTHMTLAQWCQRWVKI